MCLISDAVLLWIFSTYKDWLYYLATLESPNAGTAITAMSAAAGILFVCVAAIQIWFITGSTKSLETMFKFSATAQSVSEMVAQNINEHRTEDDTMREFSTPELAERYGDQ